MKKIRLQKLISYYGYASRRKAEILIKKGFVKVDGKCITRLGIKIDKDAIVEINDKVINRDIKKVYLALNKPENYICSRFDELKRKTIYSLISKNFLDLGIFNAGRLDYNSKGLIFLTNDGNFANIITHPSYEIIKEYKVTTDKEIPYDLLKIWIKGKIINEQLYRIRDYKIITERKVLIFLNEGKKSSFSK